MVEKRYETIDHTADVMIKAYGDNLAHAFENAGYAMFDVMADATKIEPVTALEVALEADDLGQLLVDWLSELLYLSEVEGMLFSIFEVELYGYTLKAKVIGEKMDLEKHGFNTEIKAVTYHMLDVDLENSTIKVLFDI